MTKNHSRRLWLLWLVIALASPIFAGERKRSQKHNLPRSQPEAQGVSSRRILAFIDEAEKNNLGLHSLMVVRHGAVVAEGWWKPYAATRKHMMFSASKSLTTTAVGLAIADGHFRLDDRVIDFFPHDLPATVSDNLAAMQVKHLLMMSTGQEADFDFVLDPSTFDLTLLGGHGRVTETNWPRRFLAIPVKNPPGRDFFYSSAASYMLSAIVQKTTGLTLLQYLQPRVLEPIGITGATWEQDGQGVNTGGWGLCLSTEELARFGLLYLQNGVWKGRRLIPEQWVRLASAPHIRSVPSTVPVIDEKKDREYWYGYNFWLNVPGGFRADGAFGQLSIVLPEHDAVVALTGEYHDSQKIVRLVWSHLVPALKHGKLPPDATGRRALTRRLKKLSLLPRPAFSCCPMDGISGREYRLAENTLGARSIAFHFGYNRCDFILKDDAGEHRIRCGINQWVEGKTTMPGMPPRFLLTSPKGEGAVPVAASGAWRDTDTFVMTWQFPDTPHAAIVQCRFKGDTVQLEIASSLTNFFKASGLAKGKDLTLVGRLARN